MDLSKAFDTVNYWKLFCELEERSVAHNIVKLLAYSNRNEELRVAWQGSASEKFSRSSGTRQGSPLSPFVSSEYIGSVLKRLSSCYVGCRIRNRIVNHNVYADDIVLIAPSWRAARVNEYFAM